ncbi:MULTISPECIES: hypothetical protein [Nocardia]|uniref:hypothetical protein n=1 Tax=Nocardia TaxID=1817 RepID=UPI000D6995E6|nr:MULTISPECIES: hypothetical protein [Nocardia]
MSREIHMVPLSRQRNARRVVSLRVQFDIDVNQVIDCVAVQMGSYGDELPTSRTQMLKLARRYLYDNGYVDGISGEDFDDWDQTRAAVAARVGELFPELAGQIKHK